MAQPTAKRRPPVLPAALRAGALVTVRPSSWVEDILQAITQKIQTQDHYQPSKIREEANPPLARQHVFAALADHQTPFQRRRLNPDSQKRKRTNVYDQLKERLFTGALRAGQFVSQRELASLRGATLNPVREAIRKLEAEGLINVYAQRGIQIIEGGPKAINDAYEYRLLLELSAVTNFATSAPEEKIRAIARNVESSLDLLATSPGDQSVRMVALDNDYQFHRDLVDYQGNGIISNHYRLNAARVRLFRINIGEPLQRLDVAAKEHLKILDACMNRNSDLAVKRLTQHLEISLEHTLGIRPMRKTVGRAATNSPESVRSK